QLAVQQLLKVLGGDGDLHVPVMVLVGLDGELAALGLYVEGPSGLPGQVDLDSGGVRHGAGVRPDEPGLDLAEVFLECHSVCSFPRVMLSCYHTPARNTRRVPARGNKIRPWPDGPGKSLWASPAGILGGLTEPGAVERPKISERPLWRDFIGL